MLHARGFQSVDMQANLLQQHPVKSVLHLGEDLINKLQANTHPSQLSRELRRQLFGDDGLVNDMIVAEHSTTKVHADPMLVQKCLFCFVCSIHALFKLFNCKSIE